MLRRSMTPVGFSAAVVRPSSGMGSASLVVRSSSALLAGQGQPLCFKRNIQKFWSKEARMFKGKRPTKPMSIKRAARLAARRAAEEAEAPLLDSKYGTRCTAAFIAERVKWNESYEGPVVTAPSEEQKKTPGGRAQEEPSFFARLFGRS